MPGALWITRFDADIPEPATRYLRIGGHRQAGTLTEAQVEAPVRTAGTLAKLQVYVATGGNSVSSTTVTVRKSQAATSLTVTYGSSETGLKEDNSNTVSYAATDEADVQVVTTATGGTRFFRPQIIKTEFTPTDSQKTVSIGVVGNDTAVSYTTTSTTYYAPFSGTLDATVTSNEAGTCSFLIKETLTASNLYCYVSSARTPGTLTINSRKNQANGSQSVAYAAGESGAKEDTSNTDSLASGDDYNYSIVTNSGAGTGQVTVISSQLTHAGGAGVCQGCDPTISTVAAGQTQYNALGGSYWWDTTAVWMEAWARFAHVAKNLRVSITSSSSTAVTVYYRKNGTDTSLSVAYSASETGVKEDTSNTVAVAAGDYAVFKIVGTGGSGAGIAWIGLSTVVDTIVEPGSVTSGQAFGQPSITLDAAPTSVSSGQSVGNVSAEVIVATGSASSDESVGDVDITVNPLLVPGSVASSESVAGAEATVDIDAASVTTGESVGNVDAAAIAEPGSAPSDESVGDVEIVVAAIVEPGSVTSSESVGNSDTEVVVDVGSVTTGESVGNVDAVAVTDPGSAPSDASVGDVEIVIAAEVAPDSVGTGESVGGVTTSADVDSGSVTTGEAAGNVDATLVLEPGSVGTGESVGDVSVSVGAATVEPDSVATGESAGNVDAEVVANPGGVATGESVGDVVVYTDATVIPGSVGTGESFSDSFFLDAVIESGSIGTGESVGNVEVIVGSTVIPGGISTGESLGDPAIGGNVDLGGVASGESVGNVEIGALFYEVVPDSVPTSESVAPARVWAPPKRAFTTS